MAGTVRGKIDCLSKQQSELNNSQEVFKNWYDFMETLAVAGTVVRIALQYGSGGTGVDFHDDANPFGQNAFAVYKFPANASRPQDYYVLGQWSGTSAFGSAPGNPGLVRGFTSENLGFAFASALESDGTTNANPWTGSTDNDGTDTKSTPVWAAPVGGTLAVWPVSNNYDHAASKQNTSTMLDLSTEDVRYGYIADNDNFFVYVNESDFRSSRWLWFGPISSLRDGYTPLYTLGLLSQNSIDDGLVFGDNPFGAESGTTFQEGGAWSNSLGIVETVYVTSLESALHINAQPNDEYDPAEFEEFPIYLYRRKGSQFSKGMVGTCDPAFKVVCGMSDGSLGSGGNRCAFGSYLNTDRNVTFYWDASTKPRTTFKRNGVEFTYTP